MKTPSLLLAFILCLTYPYLALATQTQERGDTKLSTGQHTAVEQQAAKTAATADDDCG